MKNIIHLAFTLGFLASVQISNADSQLGDGTTNTNWVTNGPAVFRLNTVLAQPNPAGTNAQPQKMFQYYVPGSLNNVIWTNFIAHTNGRDMNLWLTRTHPIDWPAHPPMVTWNPKSLIWGMKGITALSPCWQGEGAVGQVPVTALTRRHVYTRGHGMGPDGLNENFAGKKIWFLTTNNKVVEATVLRDLVRIRNADYTILLLTRDLPPEIEPMRVASPMQVSAKYPQIPGAPRPIFKTEQLGNVSTEVEGLKVNTWKGGDSGSPDMLPMPGELFFIRGRSTSGPGVQMQADIDELSKSARLDLKKYQLRWLDISAYPPDLKILD
jgi:hypothetical protein